MVGHLHEISAERLPSVGDEPRLRLALDIPREEDLSARVFDGGYEGVFVRVPNRILRGDGVAIAGRERARDDLAPAVGAIQARINDLRALGGEERDQGAIARRIGAMGVRTRDPELANGKLLGDGEKARVVVRVRVGDDRALDRVDPPRAQILDDGALAGHGREPPPLGRVAAPIPNQSPPGVDQPHVAARQLQDRGVALSYLEEGDSELVSRRRRTGPLDERRRDDERDREEQKPPAYPAPPHAARRRVERPRERRRGEEFERGGRRHRERRDQVGNGSRGCDDPSGDAHRGLGQGRPAHRPYEGDRRAREPERENRARNERYGNQVGDDAGDRDVAEAERRKRGRGRSRDHGSPDQRARAADRAPDRPPGALAPRAEDERPGRRERELKRRLVDRPRRGERDGESGERERFGTAGTPIERRRAEGRERHDESPHRGGLRARHEGVGDRDRGGHGGPDPRGARANCERRDRGREPPRRQEGEPRDGREMQAAYGEHVGRARVAEGLAHIVGHPAAIPG